MKLNLSEDILELIQTLSDKQMMTNEEIVHLAIVTYLSRMQLSDVKE
ncbi:hypothetical protein GNP61_14050 [Aliivibrio fischeri]|nr:hypothetical protein [Aliivibrio fischeri]MUK42675.1 hypothetical protein [Aliivibrio fischeri]